MSEGSQRPVRFDALVAQRRDQLEGAGLWRELRLLDDGNPETMLDGDQQVVQFASNDYLGLSQHPAVIAAAKAGLDRWGTGSGASRLVVGNRPAHLELERSIAEWKHSESSLVFSSGYACNVGLFSALGTLGDVSIISDELNHASIIDGARLSSAQVAVYAHNSIDSARAAIGAQAALGRRCVVATDSVFSMDGDVAPLGLLSELCIETSSLLVVDDAHNAFNVDWSTVIHPECETLWVGTLSKSVGTVGGFVAGSAEMTGWLVNAARSFVFSTALPGAVADAARTAIGIMESDEGAELVAKLRSNVELLRPGHPGAVLPVIVGAEGPALAASQALLSDGILVPAIRPPTVPAGTSRLRIALSAAHSPREVGVLADALDRLGLTIGGERP